MLYSHCHISRKILTNIYIEHNDKSRANSLDLVGLREYSMERTDCCLPLHHQHSSSEANVAKCEFSIIYQVQMIAINWSRRRWLKT